MGFFESAIALIPVLTGVPTSVYCGDLDALNQFEQEYCFSAQLQRIYTASGMNKFLEGGADDLIYDLEEPLGSRLVIFRVDGRWALLGPYVEDGWNRETARIRLAQAGASESVAIPYKAYRCKLPIAQRERLLNAAQLVAKQTDSHALRKIQTVWAHAGSWDILTYPSDYEDSAGVKRRYALENRFIVAISQGDWETAQMYLEWVKGSIAELRFVSDDFRDYLAGMAVLRTLIRVGAKWAGLSPVLIDSISQEYAQRMRNAASNDEVGGLVVRMAQRICTEVQKMHHTNYSTCVKLAMDFMSANLSQQMTVAEIAKAAGVDRQHLVKTFGQETGMTIKRYLAVQRCNIAAKLLESSGVSVQEIAAYVGYLDSNYFARVFKSVQGCAPNDYRRAYGLAISQN